MRFFIWILVSFFSATVVAQSDCAPSFAQLVDHVITWKDVPPTYQAAIVAAAETQYQKMTVGLNQRQVTALRRGLRQSAISADVPAGTNGKTRKLFFGTYSFDVRPEAAEKVLAMSTVIHETQHLVDDILKPSSVWNAKSFTLRSERRAFLRQNAFLQDVVAKIGTDGMADLLLRSTGLPAENRAAAKRVVEYMMSSPTGRSVAYEDVAVVNHFFASLTAETKNKAYRFLGDIVSLSNRRAYLELGSAYQTRIEFERRLVLTRSQDERLTMLMRLLMAGWLAYEGYELLTRPHEK